MHPWLELSFLQYFLVTDREITEGSNAGWLPLHRLIQKVWVGPSTCTSNKCSANAVHSKIMLWEPLLWAKHSKHGQMHFTFTLQKSLILWSGSLQTLMGLQTSKESARHFPSTDQRWPLTHSWYLCCKPPLHPDCQAETDGCYLFASFYCKEGEMLFLLYYKVFRLLVLCHLSVLHKINAVRPVLQDLLFSGILYSYRSTAACKHRKYEREKCSCLPEKIMRWDREVLWPCT